MRLFQKHEGKKGALFRLRFKTGPFVQTYRTLCFAPTPEMKAVFNDLREFGLPYKAKEMGEYMEIILQLLRGVEHTR
jgi:hypothetical protein